MSEDVKISVIIPVYNTGKYLEKCLESVIGQNFDRFEVICINDGSTDNSLEILEAYANADGRIRIINQENKGPSVARNAGIKEALGDYIVFVDSDDWIEGNMFERVYGLFTENRLDMLSFGAVQINKKGEEEQNPYYSFNFLPEFFNKKCFNYRQCTNFIAKFPVSTWLTAYRREFIAENGISFPEGLFFEDNIFFIKAMLSAKRAGISDEKFYRRRIRPESTMQNQSRFFKDYILITRMLKEFVSSYPARIKAKYLKSFANYATFLYEGLNESQKEEYKVQNEEIKELYAELLTDEYLSFRERLLSYKTNPYTKQICILGFKTRFKTSRKAF